MGALTGVETASNYLLPAAAGLITAGVDTTLRVSAISGDDPNAQQKRDGILRGFWFAVGAEVLGAGLGAAMARHAARSADNLPVTGIDDGVNLVYPHPDQVAETERQLARYADEVGDTTKVGLSAVDPVIDTNILSNAYDAYHGSTRVRDVEALKLVQDQSYEWVVTPTTFKEFAKVRHGGASRRRFLDKQSNLRVMSGAEAAQLHASSSFQQTLSTIRSAANRSRQGLGNRSVVGGGKSHFDDAVQMSFAEQIGIPFVTGDRKFLNFLRHQIRSRQFNAKHVSEL